MKYNTPSELHNKVYEKVFEVYEVFKNFFGEEYVDLQNVCTPEGTLPSEIAVNDLPDIEFSEDRIISIRDILPLPFILVWWPKVTVTNEHNRSVEIEDLYARVDFDLTGKIPFEYCGFKLNRATYSYLQFASDYMHSHIHRIPKRDYTEFQKPCLGRGPIKGTILSLRTECDELKWMLFCQELAAYVTVESVSGIPYHYMENIGKFDSSSYALEYNYNVSSITGFYNSAAKESFFDMLKGFTQYYLTFGHLRLMYQDGQFYAGNQYYDFMMDISNCFIEYYNTVLESTREQLQDFYQKEIILEIVIKDRVFYKPKTTNILIQGEQGKHVCTFKGRDITLSIHNESREGDNTTSTILNPKIAMYILSNVLKVINFRYSNERNTGATGFIASAYQDVFYV